MHLLCAHLETALACLVIASTVVRFVTAIIGLVIVLSAIALATRLPEPLGQLVEPPVQVLLHPLPFSRIRILSLSVAVLEELFDLFEDARIVGIHLPVHVIELVALPGEPLQAPELLAESLPLAVELLHGTTGIASTLDLLLDGLDVLVHLIEEHPEIARVGHAIVLHALDLVLEVQDLVVHSLEPLVDPETLLELVELPPERFHHTAGIACRGDLLLEGLGLPLQLTELRIEAADVDIVVLHALDVTRDILEPALEVGEHPHVLQLPEHLVLELIDAAVELLLLAVHLVRTLDVPKIVLETVELSLELPHTILGLPHVDTLVLQVLDPPAHVIEALLELPRDRGHSSPLLKGSDLLLELLDDAVPTTALHLLELTDDAA